MFLYKVGKNGGFETFIHTMTSYAIWMRPVVIAREMYIDVRKNKFKPNDFRLAEMYMQMNYHQLKGPCPVCKEGGMTHCGHLTFGPRI